MLVPPMAEYCKVAEFVQVKSSVAVKKRICSPLSLQPLLASLAAEQQQPCDPAAAAAASANHVKLIQSAQSRTTGSLVALAEEEDCRDEADRCGHCCCCCCRPDTAAAAAAVGAAATPCSSSECLAPESDSSSQSTEAAAAAAAAPDLAAAEGLLPSRLPGSSAGREAAAAYYSGARPEPEAAAGAVAPLCGCCSQCQMAVVAAAMEACRTVDCAHSSAAIATSVAPATSVGSARCWVPRAACLCCSNQVWQACDGERLLATQSHSAASAPTVAVAPAMAAVTTVSVGYAVRRRPSLPLQLESRLPDRLNMGNRLDTGSPAAATEAPIGSLSAPKEVTFFDDGLAPGQASALDSTMAAVTVSFPPPPSTPPPSDDDDSSTSDEDGAATAVSNEGSVTEASLEGDDDADGDAHVATLESRSCASAVRRSTDAGGDDRRQHCPRSRLSLVASVENGQLTMAAAGAVDVPRAPAAAAAALLPVPPPANSKDGTDGAAAADAIERPSEKVTASTSQSFGHGNKAKPELARMRLTLDLTDSRLPWESGPYNPARRLAQLLPVPSSAQHGGSSNLRQQQQRIGYDPWFASLPNTRKAKSAEPPSPRLDERSSLHGSGCTDLVLGAPRSPTLLDELHRRYYGCQKPSAGPTDSSGGGDGSSSEVVNRATQAATAAVLTLPTIVLPSDSSPAPVTECTADELIVAEICPTVSSDSRKSHMNMFGDVDRMFRGQASGQLAQSPVRSQSHDQSPTAAGPKARNREGLQHLQPGLPTGDAAASTKHLATPSTKPSVSSSDSGGSRDSARATVGASGSHSRVAKLSRAFSLSPQILRRKYRPAAAMTAAADDLRAASAAAATAPATLARDKDEHHGSSLPASLGRKKTQEIEVLEACSWLSEVGFPQYLQMFEEGRFPLELSSVEKDHAFLETRLLHCLFRRLAVLNRCAHMKLELTNRKLLELHAEDDQQCALSDKWRVNQKTGRWLRVDDLTPGDFVGSGTASAIAQLDSLPSSSSATCSKGMRSDALAPSGSATMPRSSKLTAAAPAAASSSGVRPSALLRSFGSSLRSPRRSRRQPATAGSAAASVDDRGPGALEISGPVLVCSAETDARLQRLGCVDIDPGSGVSPHSCKRSVSPTDALNNNNVDLSRGRQQDHKPVGAGWLLCPDDETDDCHATTVGCITAYLLPVDYVPGTFPRALSKAVSMPAGCHAADATMPLHPPRQGSGSGGARIVRSASLHHQRSLSSAHGSATWHATNRNSIYDNVPSVAAALVGCSEEVTQLELALRELLELNHIDRENDQESSASLSPPLGHHCLADDKHSGATPDSSAHDFGALTPNFSPPVTPLTERGGVDEKAGQSVDTLAAESRNDAGIEPDIVSAGGSSNQEATSDQDAAGSKEDLSSESAWHRERRDSGVGSSLTREPSGGKKKPRLRWHSFVKSHRPSMNSENLHVACLPAGQLMVLQKLCKLYISSVLEEHCLPTMASQHAAVMNALQLPKFVKRVKAPDYSHKHVFGVPLSVVQQRSGQPLPQCILYAMRYLRKTATDAVGIFRKSGVKSRIEKLHDDLEANPDTTDFDGLQAYDVADLLKKYFRELPECLLTNKLSQTFLAIQQCVPSSARLEAMQACVLLMPCENREVFEALLCFLSDMADHSNENQMTASNLAVCFAPSLFDVCGRRGSPVDTKNGGGGRSGSSNKMALPDQRELLDQKVAHECLTHMIADCRSLFKVPEDFLAQCHCSYMEAADPLPLAMLSPDYRSHVESCVQGLLKESREGFKGWDRCQHVSAASEQPSMAADVELWSKKVGDGNPLRLWRAAVEIEAPPVEVLDRVLRERHLWDEDFAKWRTVEKLDTDTDVFQYACSSVPPQPQRDYVELRSWRTELPGGACVLVSHSIDCPSAQPPGGGGGTVRGVVLASSYLVEPCGAGRSRLTHVSRVDMRGRSPDWYGRHYGHLEAGCLVRLRDTFRRHHDVAAASPAAAAASQQSDVPETSV